MVTCLHIITLFILLHRHYLPINFESQDTPSPPSGRHAISHFFVTIHSIIRDIFLPFMSELHQKTFNLSWLGCQKLVRIPMVAPTPPPWNSRALVHLSGQLFTDILRMYEKYFKEINVWASHLQNSEQIQYMVPAIYIQIRIHWHPLNYAEDIPTHSWLVFLNGAALTCYLPDKWMAYTVSSSHGILHQLFSKPHHLITNTR